MKLQYESYKGDLINLKYFIKVNIIKSLRTFSYEEEFAVIKPCNIDILKNWWTDINASRSQRFIEYINRIKSY